MRTEFIPCNSLDEALNKCPWAKCYTCEKDGFRMFVSYLDYQKWLEDHNTYMRFNDLRQIKEEFISPTHTISHAYPTSPMAMAHMCEKAGCFILELGQSQTPYTSYDDALKAALSLGSDPSRWSMDHPLNNRFLSSV